MRTLSTEERELLALACAAANNSYVPYSNLSCGAALLSSDRRRFTGAAIEIGSYGSSVCAPKVALLSALAQGARQFCAVAISGSGVDINYMCGDCRQSFTEFSPAIDVISDIQPDITMPLSALLPNPFVLDH